MDEPLPGPANMARDHALARHLAPEEAALRLYRWDGPTVSFGRNEPAAGRYDRKAAGRRGIAFVRRPTGGRAVLHHRELTYAVVAPLDAMGGPREAYRTINRLLADALRSLGAPAELAGQEGPAPGPDGGPCFRAPVGGEVVARGRKLVGSAQARLEGALLQHGSVLLEDDQALLTRIGRPAEGSPGPGDGAEPGGGPPGALASLPGGPPSWDRLAGAVATRFRAAADGEWVEDRPTPDELETARGLEERYGSPAWTWRR